MNICNDREKVWWLGAGSFIHWNSLVLFLGIKPYGCYIIVSGPSEIGHKSQNVYNKHHIKENTCLVVILSLLAISADPNG